MSPVSSTLPQSAHAAAQNALQAALNDPASQPPTATTPDLKENMSSGDENEVQEIEVNSEGLNGLPMSESARTVFEDPATFNVKVRQPLDRGVRMHIHEWLLKLAPFVYLLDPLVRLPSDQGQGHHWHAADATDG